MRGAADAFAHQASSELAKLHILIGDIEATRGNKDLALASRRTALKEAEALVSSAPGDYDARRLLASAHFSLALGLGTQPEALPAWEAAGRIFDALLGEKPDDVDRQRNVALVNKYIGGWYGGRKQFDLAEPHYRRAMEIDERTLAADPTDRPAQFDVSIDLSNLATALANRDVRDEAIQLFDGASRSAKRERRAIQPTPGARLAGARAELDRRMALGFDDLPGARHDAERAIAIVEPLLPKNNDAGSRKILDSARQIRAWTLRQAALTERP